MLEIDKKIKKTLTIEKYSALFQSKLDGERSTYEKSFRFQLVLSITIFVVILLTFPLFNVLQDFIALLTFSELVLLVSLVISLSKLFRIKQRFNLQKKRTKDLLQSIVGYRKIIIETNVNWLCLTLEGRPNVPDNVEVMFRYPELNLFQWKGSDIFLMNQYGDLCIIPNNLFSRSKIRQLVCWIKESMK